MNKSPQPSAICAHSNTITPRWLTYEAAAIYSGLGIRVLQNHVRAGFIRSSNACAPGASKGRRLLSVASIDAFIDAGVGKPPAELAMNANRKGGKL